MRRVAVTGGSGVIGRELIARLLARGCAVLNLDRAPLEPLLRARCESHLVELSEGGMDGLRAFRPDTVIHLAAAFERTVETPEFFAINHRDNVRVTHRLHAALPTLDGLERYVFASSYLIYRPELYLFAAPQAEARPLAETDPIEPRNLCGIAKYLGEREAAFLAHTGQLAARTVAARIYRVYGRGSNCVVSRSVRALLAGESIAMFNHASRFDYVYAGDVAEGLLRLAETPGAEGVVNLATGTAPRVADLVAELARQLDPRRRLIRDEPDQGLYEASRADVSRLRALTGWSAETGLAEGIASIVAHERSRAAA